MRARVRRKKNVGLTARAAMTNGLSRPLRTKTRDGPSLRDNGAQAVHGARGKAAIEKGSLYTRRTMHVLGVTMKQQVAAPTKLL